MSSARSTTWSLLLCALSMSLGWRIRGQFGHEIGAAIAGTLGAMSLVLASGREDWRRRIHFFAFLGGIGWSFGGSMSYMKVVAFTHSSDSDTVLYGFAGLFLIGFLWAALGGAGTALAAALSTQQLAEIFPALVTLFAAWWLQGPVTDWYLSAGGAIHNWYDSDWLEAAVALAAMVFLMLIRRRTDVGTTLVFCLTLGWWIGFLLLVNCLGWRLNPPRGDNWAGCVGIFGGLMVFCWCYRLGAVAYVALLTGILGAAGFCLGQMLKLIGAYTHTFAGMHVVLEWLQGLLLGAALVPGMTRMNRCERVHDDVNLPRWTGVVAIFFVLWCIPYLNAIRIPGRWMRDAEFPATVQGIDLVGGFTESHGWIGWTELLFLPLAVMILMLIIRHKRRPSAFIPESWLGRSQLLYLVFLWAFAFLSFAIEISGTLPGWFVTQWFITLHILLCTWLMLAAPVFEHVPQHAATNFARPIRRVASAGLLALVIIAFSGWGLKRFLFADTFAGYFNSNHVRFGPHNTNDMK